MNGFNKYFYTQLCMKMCFVGCRHIDDYRALLHTFSLANVNAFYVHLEQMTRLHVIKINMNVYSIVIMNYIISFTVREK